MAQPGARIWGTPPKRFRTYLPFSPVICGFDTLSALMRFLMTVHQTHSSPLAARLTLAARAEQWKPSATQSVQHMDRSAAAYTDAEETDIGDTNLIGSVDGVSDDIELQSVSGNDAAATGNDAAAAASPSIGSFKMHGVLDYPEDHPDANEDYPDS